MEFGDENVPPVKDSFTVSSACSELRQPTARSVLCEVNMPVADSEKVGNLGSGTGEEERCAESADPEAEAWSERTAVITRYDHETHCQLARSFVEDLADRVVAESFKETPEEEEACVTPEPEEKSPAGPSISAKKQQLFLPDLVPNVGKPVAPDAVSESDEYESADEQPLHDTVYLDTTTDPPANESGASTPTESHGWNASLQSSVVCPPLDSKDIGGRLDCRPIAASTPALEEAASIVASFQEIQGARQGVESLECTDTVSDNRTVAPSENVAAPNATADDFDLVGHFEKLALTRQTEETVVEQNDTLSQVDEQTAETGEQPLNQTVNLGLEAEEQPLNQTVNLELEAGEQPLNQTVNLGPETDEQPLNQTVNLELEAGEQPLNQTVNLGPETDEQSLNQTVNLGPETDKQPLNQTVNLGPETDEQPLNQTVNLGPKAGDQPLNQTISFEPTTAEQPSNEPFEPVETEAAPLPDALNQTVTPSSDEPAIKAQSPVPPVEESPASPTSPTSPTEFVSQEEEQVTHDAAAVVSVKPSLETPASAESVEEAPATAQVEGEDAGAARVEPAQEKPVDEPADVADEAPIVSKKGYDLSFLDALDNAENAVPGQAKSSGPAGTLHAPNTPEGESVVKEEVADVEVAQVAEAASCVERGPADGPAAVVDSASVTGDSAAVEPTPLPDVNPGSKTVNSLDEIPVSSAIKTNERIMEQEEEEVVVPKKGYDLSWLDKLDDLENASPTAISAKSKVISEKPKKEPVKKEAVAVVPEETPSPASGGSPVEEHRPDEVAGKPAAKKAPAARKPIRPRFQRPAAPANKTDPFEVEFKFDASDDPFKPKAKLSSSPPKDQVAPSNLVEGPTSNGAIEDETVAEREQEVDPSACRLSSAPDETLAEDEEFRPAEEVFRDPSALDFLMQHGGPSHGTALSRQSLFVKFDPLVGGRPSAFPVRQPDAATGAEAGGDEPSAGRRSTGESLFLFSPPHPGAAPKTERRDAPPTGQQPPVVDCLMSSDGPGIPDDVIGLHEHREALQLQELIFQDKLIQKEREIQAKENEARELRAKLEGTIEAQAQMRQIVGEYEKSISQLIADKEREKASMEAALQRTAKEKEQAIEDLKEVERAFGEFHRMYERNRSAAENLQKSEEALKKTLAAYQERMQQEQQKYETLKLHAAQKLEGAQLEMENMKRALEAENARIKAQLKKTEMRLASVETSLEQKSRENEELTKLCDELINKMGAGAK